MYTHAASDRRRGRRMVGMSEADISNVIELYRRIASDPNASAPWQEALMALLSDHTGFIDQVFNARKESLKKFSSIKDPAEYDAVMEQLRQEYHAQAKSRLCDLDFAYRMATMEASHHLEQQNRSVPGRVKKSIHDLLRNLIMEIATANEGMLKIDKLRHPNWKEKVESLDAFDSDTGLTRADEIADPHGDPAQSYSDVGSEIGSKHPPVADFLPEVISTVIAALPKGADATYEQVLQLSTQVVDSYAQSRRDIAGGQTEDAFADIPYWDSASSQIAEDIASSVMSAKKSHQAAGAE